MKKDLVSTTNYFPIHYPPQSLEMGSALVLVVEIVGVLPDVEGEEGLEAVGDGVVGVRVLGNGEFTRGIGLEPDPAGAKEGNALRFEVGFEGVERAPLFDNLHTKRRSRVKGRCPVGAGHDELGKVHVMVEYLSCIIEDSARRYGHNLLQ